MNKMTIVTVRRPITQFVIPVSKYVENRAIERRKNFKEFDRALASNIACDDDCVEGIPFRCSQFSDSHQVMMDVRKCEQSHFSTLPATIRGCGDKARAAAPNAARRRRGGRPGASETQN